MSNGISRETWAKAENVDTKLNLLFDMVWEIKIDNKAIRKSIGFKRTALIGAFGAIVGIIAVKSPLILTLIRGF